MPEGDTIHYYAGRIRPVLAGIVPEALRTPHPRFARDRWPDRLAGRAITGVEARGKHLLLRFEGDLVVHSHLRMTGAWGVHDAGARWKRSPRRAWLVIGARGHEVVQFDGPVLELLTDARVRNDPRIAGLGPDVLAEVFDEDRYLRRLREDDPTRPFGDALLDQRIVAGLGTVWRSEACHRAQVDPHRPTGRVSDEEARAAVRCVQPLMRSSARTGRHADLVYGQAGRPCPRCGTVLRRATLGDDNRLIDWCPGCQR